MFCTKIMIQQRFDDFRVALRLLQEGQHLTSRKPVSLHQQPQVFGGIRVNGKGSNDTQLGIIRQDVASVSKAPASRASKVACALAVAGNRWDCILTTARIPARRIPAKRVAALELEGFASG